jgi:hypothetical protein
LPSTSRRLRSSYLTNCPASQRVFERTHWSSDRFLLIRNSRPVGHVSRSHIYYLRNRLFPPASPMRRRSKEDGLRLQVRLKRRRIANPSRWSALTCMKRRIPGPEASDGGATHPDFNPNPCAPRGCAFHRASIFRVRSSSATTTPVKPEALVRHDPRSRSARSSRPSRIRVRGLV